jgi:hypothetical protein
VPQFESFIAPDSRIGNFFCQIADGRIDSGVRSADADCPATTAVGHPPLMPTLNSRPKNAFLGIFQSIQTRSKTLHGWQNNDDRRNFEGHWPARMARRVSSRLAVVEVAAGEWIVPAEEGVVKAAIDATDDGHLGGVEPQWARARRATVAARSAV